MRDIDHKQFFRQHDETRELTKNKLEEYRNSRGYVLSDQFELIGRAYKMHIGNYKDLGGLFTKYYSLPFAIDFWRQGAEEEREVFIIELVRLLHNFLSSTFTLIEHTRVVNRLIYSNHPFINEYEEKAKNELAGSSLVQFVKRLRNYFTHVGIAPLRLRHEIKGGEYLVDLTIIKNELLKHDVWNEKSLEFINEIENEATLRPLIDSYCKKIQDFYLWYQERFAQNFKPDFEATMALQCEYNALVVLTEQYREEGIRAMNREIAARRTEPEGSHPENKKE